MLIKHLSNQYRAEAHSSACTLASWQSPLHSASLFHALVSEKNPVIAQKREEDIQSWLGWLGALREGKEGQRELGDKG